MARKVKWLSNNAPIKYQETEHDAKSPDRNPNIQTYFNIANKNILQLICMDKFSTLLYMALHFGFIFKF